MRKHSWGWIGKLVGAACPCPSIKNSMGIEAEILRHRVESRAPSPVRRAGRPALHLNLAAGLISERRIRRALRVAPLPGLVVLPSLRAFQLQSAWRYFSGTPLRVLAP